MPKQTNNDVDRPFEPRRHMMGLKPDACLLVLRHHASWCAHRLRLPMHEPKLLVVCATEQRHHRSAGLLPKLLIILP